jgi:hypothetical protein
MPVVAGQLCAITLTDRRKETSTPVIKMVLKKREDDWDLVYKVRRLVFR